MARSQIITAASVSLFVNGHPFGRVSEFHWSSDTPLREIYGIDSVEPFELATTITKVSGSMAVYRLIRDGGAEGAGLTVPFPELTRQKYFSLALIEQSTGIVLFDARRCSVTSQAWGAATRSYITGTIAFSAIEWSNELKRAQ